MNPRANIEMIRYIVKSPLHTLLLGAGLCYTIQSNQYAHIPLVIVCPSIYAGYHCYKNKDQIAEWIRK